ncbi:MAG TPA: acetoacetate--CoA ligase [Acidimicrobiales bacterium]|nr:acetoacetate--CoA ligase [Acidimicrobiales bacterium]
MDASGTGSTTAKRGRVLWSPPPGADRRTRIGQYLQWLAAERGLRFAGYEELWRWSVADPDAFWATVWDHFHISSTTPVDTGRPGAALADAAMPGARWFPGVEVSYAAHALRSEPDGAALVGLSQSRGRVALSMGELRDQVARCRAGLVRLGVGRGDRVAAYLPNVPETVVAMLATASLGAVWSSCAPEFGTRSVVDRLRQIEPVVLLAVDGYRYGAKAVDRAGEVAAIRAALPSLRATVVLPYLDPAAPAGRIGADLTWDDLLAEPAELAVEPVPFDHPLYILYSSGTTGLPKAIVHGHGGIVLEHHKVLALHNDLGPGDRFFWFSTTGWMMWNYLVSGLLVGATPVLFDGDPGHPDLGGLWRMAAEEGVTFFGTSAPFLLACRKAGVVPRTAADLSALRAVGSTGAPLPAEGFEWVHDAVGPGVHLSSVSGGTDVCTAFVGGCPIVPVRAGEISCRYLGAGVEAYDADGRSLVGEQGELVITRPMPSMPVGFWGDDDGSRYRAAYFADHPGVWTHGDWITIYEDGACVITGRSDATLNRGGVRIGTAELYSVVEALDEVADSLVVHLEDPAGGPGRLLLFVSPAPGIEVDDDLRDRIARRLRADLSPRHVPDEIVAVPGVPRTLSGKKLEVPVKRILGGADPDVAASRGSLVNPEVLDAYVSFRP